MNVKDIMTTSVSDVKPTQSLNEAARLMWEDDCGFIPVSDEDNHVIGVITDRDICMAAYTKGQALDAISVGETMSKVVSSCTQNDSLKSAEDTMRHHQVRRLPVLDKKNRLVGILSLNDIAVAYDNHTLASHIKSEDIANTLASICKHSHGALMSIAS